MQTIITLAAALTLGVPAAAETGGSVEQALAGYMATAAEEGFTGAVLVARGDEILLAKGYGTLSADGAVPVAMDSVSTMGSITKPFTAAAIMKLASEGRLSLDDPLGRYFDDVPDDKAGITIHQLLSHQAGFPGAIGGDAERIRRDDFVEQAMAAELLFEPGAGYEYSNVGFSLAAAIIELVADTEYESYLASALFEPAGMAMTGYVRPDWKPEQMAVGRKADGSDWGTVYDRSIADGGPGWHLMGNGGMHTTPGDMLAWHRALRDGKLLPKDAERRLYGRYAEEPGGSWYGYGWSTEPTPFGEDLISHNGGNPYYFADFLRFLDSDVVIYLWTVTPDRRMHDLGRALAEIVFTGDAPPLPAPASPLQPVAAANPSADGLAARWGLPDDLIGLRAAQLAELLLGAEDVDRIGLVGATFDAGVIERNGLEGLVGVFERVRGDVSPTALKGIRRLGDDEIGVVFDSMKGELMLLAPLGPEPERRVVGLGVEVN